MKHVGMSRTVTPARKTTLQPLLKPQLAPQARRHHNKTRETKRDMSEAQNKHFARDFLKIYQNFKVRSVATTFLMNPKVCHLKVDVSCKASVNFHHMSQSPTPATEFAHCHHLTQP
jgi:hypothetical protein